MIDNFISIHDQDLILKLEQNKIFRHLKNYRYLFLGKRPIDKLGDLMDKIIVVRDLPNNIEDKKCLYDYTGHWALAHNPELVKSEFINIVHYDCLIFENFMPELIKVFKSDKNSFISYQPHPLTCCYFINDHFSKATIQACKEVYGLDLYKKTYELITANDKFWQAGGSYACSYENLKKYIDFVEPLLPYITQDPMAAHNIERTVKFFCVTNKLTEVFLPDVMEHIYNSSHDQIYQPPELIEAIKVRFNNFLEGKLFDEKKQKKKRWLHITTNETHILVKIFFIKFKIKIRE